MAKPISTENNKGPILAGRGMAAVSAERKHALDAYTAAVKLMQDGKFDKARAAFEKLSESCPVDLKERVRVHTAACDRQLRARETKFNSPQEEYDYAISLLNEGNYPDARKHLEAVLAADSSADYALYGMAVLHSMTGDTEKALVALTEAIERNPVNRIYARSDGDFQDIVDDPRFTELLYPEVQ